MVLEVLNFFINKTFYRQPHLDYFSSLTCFRWWAATLLRRSCLIWEILKAQEPIGTELIARVWAGKINFEWSHLLKILFKIYLFLLNFLFHIGFIKSNALSSWYGLRDRGLTSVWTRRQWHSMLYGSVFLSHFFKL